MPQAVNLQNIRKIIKNFLERETGHKISGPKTDLAQKGILSSFNMFQLVDFIEKKFKIDVDILTVNPDNFNSLESISKQIRLWMSK